MSILCNVDKITNLQRLKEKMPIKPFAASMVGGALVLYDFAIFGFLSPIFAPYFFPVNSQFSALLLGYATFAVGYLCNPIGALIFGHIADRIGRRASLSLSLWLMGLSTFLMGALPAYTTIGIAAPLLMVIARIIQGIASGGETNCGYIYALEYTDPSIYGLAGGIFNAFSTGGIFLGSLAGFLCTLPGVPVWTWRLPFLFGFLVVIFGIYIRRNLAESPAYAALKKDEIETTPLLQGLTKDSKQFFLYILIIGFPGIAFHVNFVYLPTFLNTLPDISDNFSRFCGTLSTLFLTLFLPVFGYYSDKHGKAKLMQAGALLLAIFSIIMFYNIYHLNKVIICIYQVITAIFLALFNGPSCGFEMQIFSVKYRCSCISFGYNISVALLCGTAPLIGAVLTSMHNGHLLLAGYLFVWGIIGYFGVRGLEQLTGENSSLLYKEIYATTN